jgi:hypothetical protein
MSARNGRARWCAAAVLGVSSVAAAPALAQDGSDEQRVERIWEEMSGEIRAGWRFLHGEEDGRFFQDQSLQDGPRLFDAVLRGETAREDAAITSIDLEAHGVGEEEQSYRAKFGRAGAWSFDGSFDLDDYSYRATGDPFPYDTRRERTDVRLRFTPSDRLTVRADWSRSLRRGDSYVSAYTTIFDPNAVVLDAVGEHRPLSQQYDAFTVGVDAVLGGGFRFSIGETVRLTQVDDTRWYDVSDSELNGSTPVYQALRRQVRSDAWSTIAKGGWRSADGKIDVTAIADWTEQPVDSRVGGSSHGYDGAFDDAGMGPKGEFSSTTSGGNDTDRSVWNGRLESSWRPWTEWEFVASVEQESITDDASIDVTEVRTYERDDVPDWVDRDRLDARIVNRICRSSLEAEWQPLEQWTFRLGEEYLRENLRVPTDTRGNDLAPTDFSSTSWRTTAGADWEPTKDVDLSLLVRHGTNDDPATPTSAETSDEVSFRGRWKASEEISVATTYRHKGWRQDTALDSASRADSVSVAPTWTRDALSVTPNVTWQSIQTRTDTTFFEMTGGGFQQVEDQVSYRTRNLIAALDVRYDFNSAVHGFLNVAWIDARGEYTARSDQASLGAEVDLRDNLSLGAALRSWRLDEEDLHSDDYRAVGAEVWVTLRF